MTNKGGGLEHWPENEFAPDARAYLYEESRARVTELIEFSNKQEDKALAILGFSITLIGASGIFGDLHLEWSLRGAFTVAALGASLIVSALSVLISWPREWETGVNVSWLRSWSGASQQMLRDAALEALVDGFVKNERSSRRRGALLPWLLGGLIVQAAAVLGVQLTAPSDVSATPSTFVMCSACQEEGNSAQEGVVPLHAAEFPAYLAEDWD